MDMLKISRPFVLAALTIASPAAEQSQDRDKPTPWASGEISGVFSAKDSRELYYSYNAGPGELAITLDVKGSSTQPGGVSTVKVDIYDADFRVLAGFHCLSGNGVSERKVERYKLPQQVQTVMRITFDDGPGSYRLRLGGDAVGATASTAKATSVGPATGATPGAGAAPNSGKSTTGAGGLQLPKQGTLSVKMKDGSTHTINLAEVESAAVR